MELDDLGEQLEAPLGVDAGSVPAYSSIEDAEGRANTSATSKITFDTVKEFSDFPQKWFDDPDFYKKVLTGVGESANRVHEVLVAYLKATDPADRNVYRVRLISSYWKLFTDVILMAVDDKKPTPKLLMVRFGMLLPNLVSDEHRKMISSIIFDKRVDEAVWYADEWVALVGSGQVAPLASDEPIPTRKNNASGNGGSNAAEMARQQANLDKASGQFDGFSSILTELEQERQGLMSRLNSSIELVNKVMPSSILPTILEPFTEEQRNCFSEIIETCRSLSTLARNLTNNYDKLKEVKEKRDEIEENMKQLAAGGDGPIAQDKALVAKESEKISQMVHMSVGRKGNHFPVLASQFFSANIKQVATRENVIEVLREIEEIDPQVFRREFRRHVHRIPPHVILLPCYGSYGLCWEPYERTNRATSRGRIAVPMFPRDLRIAVVYAIADLRWNQAKDKAAHYWMEEGLTGQFYQWFSETKQRGDVRLSFIENYILWITQESKGMQKLEREVRGIFWRTMPFSDERKEDLKMRGFVYDDLYKKDLNRAKMM